jgi:hypothetical protein
MRDVDALSSSKTGPDRPRARGRNRTREQTIATALAQG